MSLILFAHYNTEDRNLGDLLCLPSPPYKSLGLVSASAKDFKHLVKKYNSNSAIGHVRYSTYGKSNLENAQPLKIKDLCVAHNGTIANVDELSNLVGGCTFSPHTMSDTLVAAQRLLMHLEKRGEMVKAMSILKEEMVGSFCFTFLTVEWVRIRCPGYSGV